MSTFTMKHIMMEGSVVRGFLFVSDEHENESIAMTTEQLQSLVKELRGCGATTREEWVEALAPLNEKGMAIGRGDSLMFSNDSETIIDLAVLDADLTTPDMFYVYTGIFQYGYQVPNPAETLNALLAMNNLIYNDCSYMVRTMTDFSIKDTGVVEMSFVSYYPATMPELLCEKITKDMAAMGYDGVASFEKQKTQVVYKIAMNPMAVDIDPLYPQITLQKSKYMGSANLVYDTNGVAYNVPNGLDLYSATDVVTNIVKDVAAVVSGKNQLVRFYLKNEKAYFLAGQADTDQVLTAISKSIIGPMPSMADDIELLEAVAAGEMSMPILEKVKDGELCATMSVEVDSSFLPADDEDLSEQLEEMWADSVYNTDMGLSKLSIGIAPFMEREGDILTFGITIKYM